MTMYMCDTCGMLFDNLKDAALCHPNVVEVEPCNCHERKDKLGPEHDEECPMWTVF